MGALWLIDGLYIYKAAKTFQKDNPCFDKKGVDYKKLKDRLVKEFKIDNLDAWYFNSTPDPASDSQNAFHSWLKTSEPKGPGIRVKLYDIKKKEFVCKNCGETVSVGVQKGADVGIATTAMKLFERFDAIILSAGDGDFEDFIKYIVEDNDKKLYIVGFAGSISPDLQQFSLANYLLNEHYSDICDNREFKPFDDADEVVDK